MTDQVMYRQYLKRLAKRGLAAFRQRFAKMLKTGEVWKPGLCSGCATDLYVEAFHADLSKPTEVLWVCRRCRGTLDAHRPATRVEVVLDQLKIKYATFEEWQGGKR